MNLINTDVNIQNAKNIDIKFNTEKSEIELRQFGFTDYAKDTWYYMEMLDRWISFNISIKKQTFEVDIDVLYDDYCQPYDYQEVIIEKDIQNQKALEIHHKVQEIMKKLVDNGIIAGYKENDYI